ncbi:GntR family transcriptional regulator [Paeniglutamicibacter cryotolerans]|uniref:DNA-binding GntR family transcriptional regulator n=1 Tax=Paeniglutamicibacter cryotolerans TaxID=670079 RepID=A0A839QSU2_9MICC|nr:GntR family transcriptional regulator [Paeniglutamicibacter cryotolerans]MBB2995111.1 DNA-binding GntR family transcriptional regulator [Paeniglutamicibacter cryotolerans]
MVKQPAVAASALAENEESRGFGALADQVYARMLRAIITGESAPGTRLRERALSEDHNVSRVPVREAIQRLEQEGFVVTSPRRGAVVRELTIDDAQELYDARICIEPHAARAAARRVRTGEADVAALRAAIGEHAADESGPIPDETVSANLAFHTELVNLGGNSILIGLFRPLLGRMEWLFNQTPGTRHHEQRHEHRDLVQAIASGNPELASALAYTHLELGREPILADLSKTLG